MDKKIEVYTSESCHFCKDLKDFLMEKGIEYTEYEVSGDMEKQTELKERSGQLGVPVVFVDGSEMIVGFNRAKLIEVLGIEE